MGVVVCVCVWKRVCVDVRWGGHGDENYLVADTLVLGCISVSLGSLCFLYISSFLLILHSLSSLFFRFLSIPLSLSLSFTLSFCSFHLLIALLPLNQFNTFSFLFLP